MRQFMVCVVVFSVLSVFPSSADEILVKEKGAEPTVHASEVFVYRSDKNDQGNISCIYYVSWNAEDMSIEYNTVYNRSSDSKTYSVQESEQEKKQEILQVLLEKGVCAEIHHGLAKTTKLSCLMFDYSLPGYIIMGESLPDDTYISLIESSGTVHLFPFKVVDSLVHSGKSNIVVTLICGHESKGIWKRRAYGSTGLAWTFKLQGLTEKGELRAFSLSDISSIKFQHRTNGDKGKKPASTRKTQAAAASREVIVNSIGMKLRLIKPGSFVMGSNRGGFSEPPPHKVTLTRPFYIGVYEVTQDQFEQVLERTPSQYKGAKLPVETVSWDDAQEFCRKLSEIESRRYRLPTEAEWEYACRAGTTTDYYWGVDFDVQYASADRSSSFGTREVGTRLPNAWDLYDMAGNVAEWCEDWFSREYPTSGEQVDPHEPPTAHNRVVRGGCWLDNRSFCKSWRRAFAEPGNRLRRRGFRIVLDLPQSDR